MQIIREMEALLSCFLGTQKGQVSSIELTFKKFRPRIETESQIKNVNQSNFIKLKRLKMIREEEDPCMRSERKDNGMPSESLKLSTHLSIF
jgi:hypothetical protein